MNWYYSKDSAQHGPVTLEELQAKLKNNEIARDALVWRDGMADWASAQAVEELALVAADPGSAASLYAPPSTPAPAAYPPIAHARPTSGLAIASLILGILGITTCTFLTGIPAVICGHMAMTRTHPQTGNLGGRGLAVAGLVMGYISVAFMVIFVIWFIVMMGTATVSSSY